MSSARRLGPCLALLFAFAARAEDDAAALLSAADRVREAWSEATLTLKVTTTRPGAAPSTATIAVDVKGLEMARVRFTGKGDEGKMLLSRGNDAWLILPGTKNPIHVPKSQRLAGGFAAADIARTRFAQDYDAVVEREESLPSGPASVLRLMAKKGRSPSYPVVRLWVDRKERLYRKAVFLLASGRTAKETVFDEYRPYHGVLSLAKMTITDALRSGTTTVEYVDYEKGSFPDTLFTPEVNARRTSR
jgi:hypothetical protein